MMALHGIERLTSHSVAELMTVELRQITDLQRYDVDPSVAGCKLSNRRCLWPLHLAAIRVH